jgi:hypothetical protein
VVGAPGENWELIPLANFVRWSGAVHVYRRANNRWVRVQVLVFNDPAQPSFGRIGFGSEIATNGRYFWITSPNANSQFSSEIQEGPALLYRWNAGRLEFVARGPNSMSGGGIDMTRRYVIEGDNWSSRLFHFEGAHITDLSTLVPTDTDITD